MPETKEKSFDLQTIVMILSIMTSLVLMAGTFLIVGEFKGMMTEKVSNIEKNVQIMSIDHEQRLREVERRTLIQNQK